jgi:hypothetical protein
MATAVLTFTADSPGGRERVGKQTVVRGRLVSDDGDYAATGLAVTAATFGLSRLDQVDVHGLVADGATAATLFEGAYYDKTAGKIQFATSAGDGDPLDEGNTTALSAYTLRVSAYGAG